MERATEFGTPRGSMETTGRASEQGPAMTIPATASATPAVKAHGVREARADADGAEELSAYTTGETPAFNGTVLQGKGNEAGVMGLNGSRVEVKAREVGKDGRPRFRVQVLGAGAGAPILVKLENLKLDLAFEAELVGLQSSPDLNGRPQGLAQPSAATTAPPPTTGRRPAGGRVPPPGPGPGRRRAGRWAGRPRRRCAPAWRPTRPSSRRGSAPTRRTASGW